MEDLQEENKKIHVILPYVDASIMMIIIKKKRITTLPLYAFSKEEEKSKRWQHVQKHQCEKKNIFKWYNMFPTINFFSLIINNLNDSIVWISIIMILAHEFNFRVLLNLWSLRIRLFWVLANLRPWWVQICGYASTEILTNLNLWVFANSKFSRIQNCKVWSLISKYLQIVTFKLFSS